LTCLEEYDSIEWQIKSADGEYTAITLNSYVDTDTAYYIKPADKTKYLRAKVTVGGVDYYTDTIGPLPASKGPNSNENAATAWESVPATADSDYVFKVADDSTKSFVLADTTDGLFVVANDFYGRVTHDSTNTSEMYKNVDGNIAKALEGLAENGSWTANSWGNHKTFTIPESIKKSGSDYLNKMYNKKPEPKTENQTEKQSAEEEFGEGTLE